MLHAGLDLSRKRLDFHLLDPEGATVEVGAAPPDADGLRGLSERIAVHDEPIRAAIELEFPRFRGHLSAWLVLSGQAERIGCDGSTTESTEAVPPGVQAGGGRAAALERPTAGAGRA